MMKEHSTQPRVPESILAPLKARMKEERFESSFSAYVRGILARYRDGLLVNREEVEAEIREQIYAELAADGIIVPPRSRERNERQRKAG